MTPSGQPTPEPRLSPKEALKRSNERLQLLAETAGSLLLTEQPRELIRGIFHKLSAHLGLEIYFNYLITPGGERLRLDSWSGVSDEVAREIQQMDLGEAVCGAVTRAGRPIVFEDTQASSDSCARLAQATGATAYICYPLLSDGQLIGTLSFGSRSRAHFAPDELELMQTVASQVAAAIERKRTRDQLEERAHMLDLAHVFMRDVRGSIVFWNRGAEELFGWTRQEALGRISHQLLGTVHPQPLEELERALAEQESWAGELAHRRRDGTLVVTASHWVLHRDAQGQPEAVLEVHNDITELRRAEAALRESEEQYRTLAEALPVMVFTTGAEGRCDYVNQRWQDYTGLDVKATREQPGRSIHPDDREAALERWNSSLAGGTRFEAQYRIRAADGRYRWFLARGVPLRNERGRVVKWLGTCMDVEDHKRMEEAVQTAQKSESIGILAGGIAHQFNNLLTGILGGASIVMDSLPAEDPSRPLLEGVLTSSQRAAELTSQLLAYAGKGRFVEEPVDLSAVVAEVTRLMETGISRKIGLRLELASALPPVQADAGQMRQLVMGLVMNAAEAVGDQSGTVRVATGVQRVDARLEGRVTDELPPGTYAWLEVADTGCGMDAETQARIFDPFFTTKFMGRGLGLPAALGIVRALKGAIQVHSAPDRGSTFRVLLPARVRERKESRGAVLVVDDEEIVRNTARAILARAGYRVLLAENGREAVSVLEASADEVGLVLLDMAMPVMSGEEAMRHFTRIRPDIPVLVASGYDETEAARRFAGQPVVGFIQKPYTARELSEKVALAARQAARPGAED